MRVVSTCSSCAYVSAAAKATVVRRRQRRRQHEGGGGDAAVELARARRLEPVEEVAAQARPTRCGRRPTPARQRPGVGQKVLVAAAGGGLLGGGRGGDGSGAAHDGAQR